MQLSTWKFMSNMFAVVELKYSAKSYFVVRTDCIKNFNKKFGNTLEFLCFISPNKDEKPNFQADYKREYCGTPGLFKIFVVKTFDSLQAAMYDLGKKRLFSVPTKFRDPSHTDTEVLKDQEKERRKETNQNKKKMDVAKRTNMNYLVSEINSVAGGSFMFTR
ncbi:hypothetical protein HA402_009802 [Bradysia odoriphaga]|nr:hypothetical protein HA402_009802 [Bradysia odoriphaga]